MNVRAWIGAVVLIAAVVGVGYGLAMWKAAAIQASAAAGANQPEPMETVTAAAAAPRPYRRTTTSIGTVLALQSVTLRNEIPGTVRHVSLQPGKIVEAGAVLVKLDTAVEEAELKAQESQAALAELVLQRAQKLSQSRSTSQEDLERARAEHDVALAHIARVKAVIARKSIRAPFRARVGLSDVHPGQFLSEGDKLTTLQGVDDAVHIDFAVNQHVAAELRVGDQVDVFATPGGKPAPAAVVAVDAKIDIVTRNATVRVRLENTAGGPAPGASVRVQIPVGSTRQVVGVPANAVRKGAAGDFVFVLTPDQDGKLRAHERPVESGALVGDEMLIFNGLKVGEKIAASGSFKLREGVLVAVAKEAVAGKSP